MLSKADIKYIQQLSLNKYRRQYNCFIAEGDKTVSELINSNIQINQIYALNIWKINNQATTDAKNISVTEISERELKKISFLKNPKDVVAIVKIPEYQISAEDLEQDYSILLDRLQDPGNLGTIIRIADWFGIKNIICSTDTADAYNPKVVQSTMGSIARVKIFYENLTEVLESHKEIPVFGALIEGRNVFKEKFPNKGFLIIGNEAKGISQEIQPYIHHKISIPSSGQAESLNAAVAAGIICAVLRNNLD